MTSSKKKTGQMVTVDAHKLGQGLKSTFEGVAMVFDSIGVEAGFQIEEKPEKPIAVNAKETKTEKGERGGKINVSEKPAVETMTPDEDPTQYVEDGTEAGAEDVAEDTAGDDVDDGDSDRSDNPVDDSDAISEAEETKEVPAVPSVSMDDVTKIIVQKIKQDRSNTQTIRQILRKYGTEKVSELKPAKYEAFLTDIAVL